MGGRTYGLVHLVGKRSFHSVRVVAHPPVHGRHAAALKSLLQAVERTGELRRLARQRGLSLQNDFCGVKRVADDDEGAATDASGDEALQAAVGVSFGFVSH
jgi:hypothetical protein